MSHPPAPLGLPLPVIDDERSGALLALYRDLDEDLARLGFVCVACGRCCRFTEYGHELWLTGLELAWLIAATGSVPCDPVAGSCPWLSTDGHCSARSGRALGCRVYFCVGPNDTIAELAERYFQRVLVLHRAWGLDPEYGELLASLAAWRAASTIER